MALKVIGTGFGRTGTDSMREARQGPVKRPLERHIPVQRTHLDLENRSYAQHK
jgi:hypothetical protein